MKYYQFKGEIFTDSVAQYTEKPFHIVVVLARGYSASIGFCLYAFVHSHDSVLAANAIRFSLLKPLILSVGL